jgi:magnesium chelatase family protein
MFLDEFPLFNADIIEALRPPLDSDKVTIARGEESATLPARAMVVDRLQPMPLR